MRIPLFYGLVRGPALDDYWHNNSACFVVQAISPDQRRPGTNGYPFCPYCAILNTPVKYRNKTTDRL
jgi:hypothetical protein